MNHRLYRSPDDRILAGVAGGMAETYDLDPALVRIGWAFLMLVTGGIFLLLYIVMALVVPLRPAQPGLWAPVGDTTGGVPLDPYGQPIAPPAGPEFAGPLGSASAAGAPPSPPARPPVHYGYGYRRRERRDSSGALVFGVILIAVGAFFLFRQFIPALDWSLIWPLIVVFGGVLLIAGAINRPRRTS